MSVLEELGQKFLGVTKALTLMEERHKRREEDDKELRAEVAELRKQIAALTTRVAVLEKGQEVVDARVETVITKGIAHLEAAFRDADAERKIEREVERRIADALGSKKRTPHG